MLTGSPAGNGLHHGRLLGYAFDALGLRAPDPHGSLLAEIDDARTGGADLPATVGMYRPDLARILLDRATALGVKVRFGTCVSKLDQDATGAEVLFADGSAGRYDLVVGADGVRSATRRMLEIDLEPRPTGMGIWRAFTSRPASISRTDLVYGGPVHIAGYCPTGADSMYRYLVEDAQDRSALTPAERLAVMRGLAEHYHGPWDEVRALLTDPSAPRRPGPCRWSASSRTPPSRPGRSVRRHLDRLHAGTFTGPTGVFRQRTEPAFRVIQPG